MSSGEKRNSGFWRRFRPVDIATLAYLFVEIIVVMVFMRGRPGWTYLLFFYLSAACIVFLMIMFPFDELSFPWRLFRVGYPMILILFFYKALGPQLYLVFDKPFDWMVHQFELRIFGVDPAFAMQRYVDIWLNEVMNFGYLSFYWLLPAAIIVFVLLRKWKSLEKTILSCTIAFYLCYIAFIFYPVSGPRFYLGDTYYLPIIGPFFTPLTQNIVNSGGHYGAGMLSSHSAIAFIVSWRIGKDIREFLLPAILISLLLCASTVYGRYHYLTDAVAGIIIGGLGVWIAGRWHE